VELKKDEIDAAIKFFRSKNSGEMKLSEAMKLSTGQGESETGLAISGFEAKGSLSSLFEQLSGRKGIKQMKQPDSFSGKLRPYQVKGFSWLAFLRQYGLGACLADDMGLGKTIQLLALLLKDKEEGEREGEGNERATLLICPTSVVGNWQREAKKFAPSLRVLVHHGISERRKNSLKRFSITIL